MPEHDALQETPARSEGVVHAVRGAVVDVVFTETELPKINSALVVEWDRPTPLILVVSA
jgi:F-type H+-transporting ATPase subunit beta